MNTIKNRDVCPIRVLVVDNDRRIANILKCGLELEGYEVDVANNGEEGLALGRGPYDLIMLDPLLPGITGTEVCQTLREEHVHTPILMLSTKDEVQHKVMGLHLGADDFLTKPFAFEELVVRIHALLRRGPYQEFTPILSIANLTLNRDTREVWRGSHQLVLTSKEFALLEYLMSHPNRPLPRKLILKQVWASHPNTLVQIVDVYIRYLRKKVDHGYKKKLIRTVRDIGYKISDS